jgi:hypothetical protein
MLDRGLTEDGAAQALGWPKNRVTARVKILELPERAQQLIGEDNIPLAAVDQLRAIGKIAPDLLDAVIAYLDDGNAWAAERLTREPGWLLDAAPTHTGDAKVFAAYLHSAGARAPMTTSRPRPPRQRRRRRPPAPASNPPTRGRWQSASATHSCASSPTKRTAPTSTSATR